MPYHKPDENKPQYARVLIMGEPGVGKTLLASTLPGTFILDLENRAAHAARNRWTFTKDRAGLQELQTILRGLGQLKPSSGGLLNYTAPSGDNFGISAVQLDSMDELQLNIDLTLTSTGFDYWREMLNQMRTIVTLGRSINAHFICVAHTKEQTPDPKQKNLIPQVDLALQGAAFTQVPRWFDLILNIIYNPVTGRKEILTQNTVIAGKLYRAKDALNLFNGSTIPVIFKDGRPSDETMRTIIGATTGGVVESMFTDMEQFVKRIEKELMEASTNPVSAHDFLAYCHEKGWDMSDGGKEKELLVKKFGAGYDPAKGVDYIAYLKQLHDSNKEQQDS